MKMCRGKIGAHRRHSYGVGRINTLLLLCVLGSAFYLVRTQYQSRLLYTTLDRAVAEARQLETEHERLEVEKRAQATPLRVETMARDKLSMHTATPAITLYVPNPIPVALPSQGIAPAPIPSVKANP